jgi:hypothetical protein
MIVGEQLHAAIGVVDDEPMSIGVELYPPIGVQN